VSHMETLVTKLQTLATKSDLSSVENAEAQATMQSLKSQGFSNEEISNLSNGRWSVSTVKGYTTGISAPTPSPWKDALSALIDIIAANLTINDIKEFLELNHLLATKKLTLENVVEIIEVVSAAGLDLTYVVDEIKKLQEAGLSLKNAVGVITLKKEVEGSGFTLEVLPTLAKIAQQYKNQQQALEAFSLYASLASLQADIDSAKKELEKIKADQKAVGKQLEHLKEQSKILQGPIQAYQKLVNFGFSERTLINLSQMISKYADPRAVTQAVKTFLNLEEIKSEFTEVRSELAECKSKISETIAGHNHLMTAINMCEQLITDHQYGLDALGTILSVAQKFGEPVEVLKAVESYGKLLELEKRINERNGVLDERDRLLSEMEGRFKEAQKKLEELSAVALHVGRETGRLEGLYTANENPRRLMNIVEKPGNAGYAEHGPIIMMLARNIRKWVAANENQFKSPYTIKSGLEELEKELGGLS